MSWWLHKSPGRWRLAFPLIWLAATGVALAWLPESLRSLATPPFVTAGVVSLLVYALYTARVVLFGAQADHSPQASRRVKPGGSPGGGSPGGGSPGGGGPGNALPVAGAVVLILFAFLHSRGHAAAALTEPEALAPGVLKAAPQTVLLVPGPDNSPDNQSVLAPPELLAQLEKMASSDSWILHSAILVSARYEGQLVDNAARFQADLRVHCFQDNATLELPLEDVMLEKDAVVDGIKTNIVSLRPAAVMALKLAAGTHRVALQFSVPVHTMGEANELRFPVPRVTQNQLVLNLPAGVSSVQTLVRQGQQQVTSDTGGVHLEADLGSINGPLHVRWLQEGKQPVKPIVKVREAYLWHLRRTGAGWKLPSFTASAGEPFLP